MVDYALKWVWSKKASGIALIAIVFDAILHYILPSNIAIQEGILYFVVKYIVVEIVAALILAQRSIANRRWSPFVIGFVGSSAFGAIYYVFPWISSDPGYLTLPYRLLWGMLHALVIWMAAAFVLRRKGEATVVLTLLLLTVSVALVLPLVLGY